MRIVYFSNIFFTDCDFPLIKTFQKMGQNIFYIINCSSMKGGLFNIKTYLPENGLFKAKDIPEFCKYANYMDLSNIYVITKNHRLFNRENYHNFKKVNQLIKDFNPDVIHITSTPGLSELQTYRFWYKTVLTVHDPFTHSGETNFNNEWKRLLAFHVCRRLILLNNIQIESFKKHYHINNSKIYTNRLGSYDCLEYLSSMKPLNLTLPQNYILFFGHFSPYKGIDVLCKAMTKVHKSHPEVKCIIAGNGNLNFDITPYQNLDYIILKNEFIETDHLAALISRSLFTVCPYKDATQSGVVSSSFALNKPVIATRVGGLPEAVTDGEKGLIAEPNDVNSLTEKIQYLLDNPLVIKELELNIKNDNAKPEHSWDVIADKYIKVYKTLKNSI